MSLKLAILIPVGPRHTEAVRLAVRSCSLQRVPHTILVVNDSNEATLPLPGAVVQLHTGGRKGVAVARNIGAEWLVKNNFDFLVYLDADDVLVPHALEMMLHTYAHSDAAYVYGDGYNVRGENISYWQAYIYDRRVYRSVNLHNVTALIPVSLATQVPWTDAHWEDYVFFATFALKGWCGARCYFPLIAYHLDKGERRVASYAYGPEYAGLLTASYKAELEYAMGCCGANKALQDKAQTILAALPDIPQSDGTVRVAFTGSQLGWSTYRVGKNVYRGRVGAEVYAIKDDVPYLERFGVWAVVPPRPTEEEVKALFDEEPSAPAPKTQRAKAK